MTEDWHNYFIDKIAEEILTNFIWFKMPSLPDNDQSCNPHLAALVAINIVTQVLDEAQDIVNTAKDSGQPWRYIWNQKKGNGEFYKNTDILGFIDIKSTGKDVDSELKHEGNVIVTMPQKEADNITKNFNDNGLIGQGDEDMQAVNRERNTDFLSPSVLINCLFDMTELEQVTNFDISEDIPTDSRDLITTTITQLVESYVNLALDIASGDVSTPEEHVIAESIHSSYSFLADALVSNITKNVTYYIDYVKDEESNPRDTKLINKMDINEDVEEIKKKDIDLYEETFSTLNRDYDKCSDGEDYVEDLKSLVMQEVELPSNMFSDIAVNPEAAQTFTRKEDLAASGVVVDQKHSLVKRCRLQSAKLMNRLRCWWWKQRLIGKRKESRSGLMSGMCPLSPKARNRAASLLDNRKLRSPSPSRTVAWKFNTLNEALINSYERKEFELDSSNALEEY